MRTCRCTAQLSCPALAFLQDHAVKGRPLFPAAAFLEAAASAAYQLLGDDPPVKGQLHDIAFMAPLLLSSGKAQKHR